MRKSPVSATAEGLVEALAVLCVIPSALAVTGAVIWGSPSNGVWDWVGSWIGIMLILGRLGIVVSVALLACAVAFRFSRSTLLTMAVLTGVSAVANVFPIAVAGIIRTLGRALGL